MAAMRIRPPELAFAEEPDWRDDAGWVREFERQLERKLMLGMAGLLPPLPAADERLVDQIVELMSRPVH